MRVPDQIIATEKLGGGKWTTRFINRPATSLLNWRIARYALSRPDGQSVMDFSSASSADTVPRRSRCRSSNGRPPPRRLCQTQRRQLELSEVLSYRSYGRGAGLGRGRGVGVHLPSHGVDVGVAVAVAVGEAEAVPVAVAVGVAVAVAVAVGVGVGVGVAPASQKISIEASGVSPSTS